MKHANIMQMQKKRIQQKKKITGSLFGQAQAN